MSYPRPDQLSSESAIQDAQMRNKRMVGAGKTALSLGGAALTTKIAPFLSEYLPMDLAMKGINKVAPALGKILQTGVDQGLDLKGGFDYIKSQMKKEKKGDESIIKQYSPELYDYIMSNIADHGVEPMRVARMLQRDRQSKKILDQISKDTGQDWMTIFENEFMNKMGSPAKPSQDQEADQEFGDAETMDNMMGGMAQQAQQPQQMQPQQPQNSGAGDQALMDAINRVLSL